MKSAAQMHLDAIKSGKVTKTNVIGIRKAINHIERLRGGWSGNRNAATDDEVFDLECALQSGEPIVCGELHETGLKLLQSPRYRKRWTEKQSAIIATAHQFHLVRFDRIGARGMHSVPVYRVFGESGDFLFRNIPWQSGGNGPEVVGEEG